MAYPRLTPIVAAGSSVPRYLDERASDVINVKDFGAKGDGVDDTAAIEAAFAYAQSNLISEQYGVGKPIVFFPKGQYRIKRQINISKCVEVYGEGWWVSQITFDNDETEPVQHAFYVTGQNCRFKHFGLQSAVRGRNIGQAGIYVDVLPTETPDMDDHIVGLHISKFDYNVVHYGRGLQVNDSYFSYADHGACIDLRWPDEYQENPFPAGNLPYGFRGIKIVNTRLQAARVFVQNTGTYAEYITGILIDGVLSDSTCPIFRGVLKDGTIANVVAVLEYSSVFTLTDNSKNYTISNVVIIGENCDIQASAVPPPKHIPTYGFYFEGVHKNGILDNIRISRVKTLAIACGNDCVFHSMVFSNILITYAFYNNGSSQADVSNRSAIEIKESHNCTFENIVYDAPDETIDGVASTFCHGVLSGDGTTGQASSNLNINNVFSTRGVGPTVGWPNGIGVFNVPINNTGSGRSTVCNSLAFVNNNLEQYGLISFFDKTSTSTHHGDMKLGLKGPFFVISLGEGGATYNSGNNHKTIMPSTNNDISLGNVSNKLSDVYATNGRFNNLYSDSGTVSTSDERAKQSIEDPTDAILSAWGNVGFKVFQFNDAVEEKGKDKARLHVGVVAQDVAKAFAEQGLDANRYGLFCYDEWEDEYIEVEVPDKPAVYDDDGNEISSATVKTEKRLLNTAGNKFGIRYTEALALECAYLRSRISKMQEQVDILVERVNQLTNNSNK